MTSFYTDWVDWAEKQKQRYPEKEKKMEKKLQYPHSPTWKHPDFDVYLWFDSNRVSVNTKSGMVIPVRNREYYSNIVFDASTFQVVDFYVRDYNDFSRDIAPTIKEKLISLYREQAIAAMEDEEYFQAYRKYSLLNKMYSAYNSYDRLEKDIEDLREKVNQEKTNYIAARIEYARLFGELPGEY